MAEQPVGEGELRGKARVFWRVKGASRGHIEAAAILDRDCWL